MLYTPRSALLSWNFASGDLLPYNDPMKKSIKSYSLEELKELTQHLGQPKFRAEQLIQWLYFHHVSSFEEMTNLPKNFREQLALHYTLPTVSIKERQVSADKSRKYVLELADGEYVETVAIPETTSDAISKSGAKPIYDSSPETLSQPRKISPKEISRPHKISPETTSQPLLNSSSEYDSQVDQKSFSKNLSAANLTLCPQSHSTPQSMSRPAPFSTPLSTSHSTSRPTQLSTPRPTPLSASHSTQLSEKTHSSRLTVCFSTQVGCAIGCSFCATGQEGFSRNLDIGEILDQIFVVQNDFGQRASNIVAMGQGEPFLNYDNTLAALHIMNHPKLLGIGARHITVSTCGILNGINKFAHVDKQFTLAISLHSARQNIRDELMPHMKNQNLDELKTSLKNYISLTNRRVTLEYMLIKKVNDSEKDLSALLKFCGGLLCHVNLLPLNPVSHSPFQPSDQKTAYKWINTLKKKGIEATLRNSRGKDIAGACGQLKNSLIV